MPATHTARRFAAAALALLPTMVATSDGTARARAPLAITSSGTWTLAALPVPARHNITTDIAMTIAPAKRVLGLIDGSVAIDTHTRACRGTADSCSFRAPTDAATPWRIHLSAAAVAGTYPSQRFMTLHEMGHAVWVLVFSQRDRDAFVADVERSLAGKKCRQRRHGGPCAVVPEMFADEFARWAGGFHVSMTGYETPALLSTATFTALIETAMVR